MLPMVCHIIAYEYNAYTFIIVIIHVTPSVVCHRHDVQNGDSSQMGIASETVL